MQVEMVTSGREFKFQQLLVLQQELTLSVDVRHFFLSLSFSLIHSFPLCSTASSPRPASDATRAAARRLLTIPTHPNFLESRFVLQDFLNTSNLATYRYQQANPVHTNAAQLTTVVLRGSDDASIARMARVKAVAAPIVGRSSINW